MRCGATLEHGSAQGAAVLFIACPPTFKQCFSSKMIILLYCSRDRRLEMPSLSDSPVAVTPPASGSWLLPAVFWHRCVWPLPRIVRL